MFAVVEKANVCAHSEYLGCPKVEHSGEVIAIKTKRLYVVHNCLDGNCQPRFKKKVGNGRARRSVGRGSAGRGCDAGS